MSEKASRFPAVEFKALRGLNLRKAKPQLDSGECDRLFGYYPSQTGAMSRIPGKTTWRVREDADGSPIEVTQLAQAFMGRDYIITQFGDSIALDTLDDLLNRTAQYELTPTPIVGVGNYALLAHVESNNTNGGALGGSSNTFVPSKINTVMTDEGGMVQAIGPNSFVLGLGTYRIDCRVLFGGNNAAVDCRAGLYSVSNSAFKTHLGTSYEILGTSGVFRPGSGFGTQNTPIRIMGRFQVTAPTETLTIAMAGAQLAGFWQDNPIAMGVPAFLITSKPENYCLIQLTQE